MKKSKFMVSLMVAVSGMMLSAAATAEVRLMFGANVPMVAAPGPVYSAPVHSMPGWQNGYWANSPGRQVWVPGHWATAPAAPVYQGPVVYRYPHRHYHRHGGRPDDRGYHGNRSW